MSFAKLDSGIVHSSVWAEPAQIRVVWITLLAVCDKNGYARLSLSGLQRAANIELAWVKKALAVFESPDDDSRTPSNEGRRVKRVEGGWHILNYCIYRDNMKEEAVKEYFAEAKRKQRENGKMSKTLLGQVPDSSVSVSVSASTSSSEGVQGEIPGMPSKKDSKAKASSVEEVKLYCLDVKLTPTDGEWFWDKCEGCGWKNSGKPIVDWKATVRAWSRMKIFPSQKVHPNGPNPKPIYAHNGGNY